MSTQIKIIIVDDHGIFRSGVKQILEKESYISIVAEGSTGKEAIELVREHLPDLVLMDVILPEMDGIKATRIIKKEFPEVEIIGLSMNVERSIITAITEAGARGYLVKDSSGTEVIHAIKTVHRGESFFSGRILQNGINIPPPVYYSTDHVLYGLNESYLLVLEYLCEGYAAKQIAAEMNISPKTVDWYKTRLKKITGTKTTAELITFAAKNQIGS